MKKLEVGQIRKDFPILTRSVHGKPLIYLDNGATLQKPRAVLDALEQFYTHSNANVHRGVHFLSQVATEAYESVRMKVCRFIGTEDSSEIIFTKGTTDALNLLASSLGDWKIQPGDVIAVTRMEHHANFVPWQQLAKRKGADFRIIELDPDLRISESSLEEILALRPKVVALSLMSNVSGVITPAASIIARAKAAGAIVVADAAQAIAHQPIRISELGGVDFIAFSAHKIGGPTGVGVLWGKASLLNAMPPYQFGGDMISQVGDTETTWNTLPWKFEAGTPNFADVVGLGAAIDYLERLGMKAIQAYESELTKYTLAALNRVPGLKIFGPRNTESRGGVFSFALEGVHPHDLATFLDVQGIAVRAGHHCAQPLLKRIQQAATTRASLSFYNTEAEVDALTGALLQAQKYFSKKQEGPARVNNPPS